MNLDIITEVLEEKKLQVKSNFTFKNFSKLINKKIIK